MRNVEVKARVVDFGRVRRHLRDLGFARERQVLEQTDSYFHVTRGRLKLRQRKGRADAELILYARPDVGKPRASHFERLRVDDPPHMLRLLRAMFEPGVRVRKRRELWLRDDVRVHLDEVSALGRFIEVEVPVRTGRSANAARRIMGEIVRALDVSATSMLAQSYADLLATHRDG